uniref:Uncharacterized protein n=1 Tax=Romanomermis culicivorax TaxID=13658 RepID=A0A915I810_ROMCU
LSKAQKGELPATYLSLLCSKFSRSSTRLLYNCICCCRPLSICFSFQTWKNKLFDTNILRNLQSHMQTSLPPCEYCRKIYCGCGFFDANIHIDVRRIAKQLLWTMGL